VVVDGELDEVEGQEAAPDDKPVGAGVNTRLHRHIRPYV
jgi:hypothetical protein